MATLPPDVTAALATLRSRWGAAAPRAAGEVAGALALSPAIEFDADSGIGPAAPDLGAPEPPRISSTGFPELDGILGPGGLPRGMGLSLKGDLSSGRTTLALRLAAAAPAGGAAVAAAGPAGPLRP